MSTLKLLPPDFEVNDVEILKKVNVANIALAKLNGLIYSLPNYEILLQPLTVREAVASSEIENIRTTTVDILQAEILGDNAMLPQTQKETLHYKKALLYGLDSILKQQFLATNQIVSIQSILEPNKSGIRSQMGTVIANGYGEVVYTPPQHEKDIRDLLKNMDEYTNFEDDVDPLVKLAILHYQFESIHPFYDGNGRTGRIIMILYLVLVRRLDYPVLFLSGYLLQHKEEYYKHLQEVHTKQTWKEWILFVLDAIIAQSQETAQKVQQISNLKLAWKKLLKEQYPQLYTIEVLDYLFGYAFYTQTHMQEHIGYTRPTLVKYMDKLKEGGYIQDKRVGKERLFFIPAFIELLS
jgi:Fic family protein